MPDRNQPGSAFYVVAYLLAAAAGTVGVLIEPSVTVRHALADAGLAWMVPVWSAGFITAGGAAVTARLRRWYCAEVWAVVGIGGLFLLWSALVAVAGSVIAWQAGLGFACAAFFMFGWARYRRFRIQRNASSVRDLRQAVDETVGEALRRDREA